MTNVRYARVAATMAVLALQLVAPALSGQSAPPALIRFGMVTDVHFADIDPNGSRMYRESDRKLAECVRLMNDQRVDFLVELGDFKDQDVKPQPARTLEFLRHIESALAGFTGPRYHVLGNHDVDSLSKAEFLSIATSGAGAPSQAHYSFVRKGVRFVVLDADHKTDGSDYERGNFDWGDANIDTAQLIWLERTLTSSREPVVVFIHQQLDGEGAYYVKNATAVRRVLEVPGKVLAVFQGHRHEGAFSLINGIPYYTLKGVIEGGGPENNAYAIVEVRADRSVHVTGYRRAESRDFRAGTPNPPTLATEWPVARLRDVLAGPDDWRPVPRIDQRDRWASLSPRLSERIVRRGEQALASAVEPLPATLFLDYTRNGNRTRFEDRMFDRRDRLHALVLAECVEDRGRFLDAIVDTAWAITEESSWTIPAHQGAQKASGGLPDTGEPIVDLFSAQTAHSLAWTVSLLGDRLDKVSPLVRPRLTREIDRRVLSPYLARDDFGWMGFGARSRRPNNWNPWINSNILAATLLVEPDRERRVQLVHKALRSLDRYLGPYPTDGSCDEGPAYWGRAGASLFESLELLKSASAGRLDVFANPVIRDIGRFVYRARIAGDWFVNVGDSGAKVKIDRGLVFRYGASIDDLSLRNLGSAGTTEEALALDDRSIGRTLFSVFGWDAIAAERTAPAPLPRDVWLSDEDMQLMAARDRDGSADGLYVAAWGSHNDQSHNHNDVGNTIIYVDGAPVLVDAGRPTYTSQTFSNRRYEIWNMQSAFHNLPTVNGVMQAAGKAFCATDVIYARSEATAELAMDIAPAYPVEAGLTSWVRRVRLSRGREVVVSDAFALARATRDVSLNLMTPCEVTEDLPGVLRLACGRIGGRAGLVVFARFDARAAAATVERISLDDPALTASWGDHLSRIVLSAREPVQRATWTLTVSK